MMSEWMGLIRGEYDGKKGSKKGAHANLVETKEEKGVSSGDQSTAEEGFLPGGASLHVASTPHGPDAGAYAGAIASDTSKPVKFNGGLAFMFETSALLRLTEHAVSIPTSQSSYRACWDALPRASISSTAGSS